MQLNSAILCAGMLAMAGCDANAPVEGSGNMTTNIWCTPDGHANWINSEYANNAVAVPKLDANGKPVMCAPTKEAK